MEKILAIETSTAHGSVAWAENGRIVDLIEFVSDRSHNSGIFAPLASLLKHGPPDLIAEGTGPGNYSGIRVGIAAGLGISLAHGVPLAGLPSLTAIGEAFGLERYALAGDARRGAFWYAEVTGGILTFPPVVDEAAGIAGRTSGWPGPLFTLDAASPEFCQAQPVRPRADVLACRANALTVESVEALSAVETEPLYLRAPFITVSRKAPGLSAAGRPANP